MNQARQKCTKLEKKATKTIMQQKLTAGAMGYSDAMRMRIVV
jgi:hypothetical protein